MVCRDCGTTLIKDHETTAPVDPDGLPCTSADGAHTMAWPVIVSRLGATVKRWCVYCCRGHRHRAAWLVNGLGACDRHLAGACCEADSGCVLSV